MKSKIRLLIISLLILPGIGLTQSIERSVIASAGDFNSASSIQLSWTAGQSSTVETYSNSSAVLTQGFQQSDFSTSINENSPFPYTLTVYPNPGSGEFNFDFNTTKDGNISFQLYDLNGKLILGEGPFSTFSGYWQHQIQLNLLPDGIYHCRFIFTTEDGISSMKNIKISILK